MKKIVLLLLLLFTLSLFSGCSKAGELNGVDNISVEDIFNQKEDKYYIYFHRIDCADCEKSDPTVINYAYIIDEFEGCEEKRKIYAVLLYTESENPGEDVYIYREYTGDNGQGTDGKYYVDHVTNWKELYIASTASLISIDTNPSGVKEATYEAQGSDLVNQTLEDQLNNCHR